MVVKMAVKDTPTLLGNKLKQYYYRVRPRPVPLALTPLLSLRGTTISSWMWMWAPRASRDTLWASLSGTPRRSSWTWASVFRSSSSSSSSLSPSQGNEENELPEVLMGAVTCVHLDAAAAKKL
jgi:hypothetical protein